MKSEGSQVASGAEGGPVAAPWDVQETQHPIFEITSQGVVLQNRKGEVIAANPAAQRILGLTLDQLLGKTSRDPCWGALGEDGRVLTGDDHPAMVALRTGQPVGEFVMGVLNPRLNVRRWIRVSSTPLRQPGEGTVSQVYTTLEDITEHHCAEEAYRMLFREMLNGYALHEILCDAQGRPVNYRFLAVNPAFERMTGLKAAEIVGRTVLEVLPGTEPRWIETYGRVALTGEPIQFASFHAALGRHFEVSAFRPAPGQFACVLADITERKQAEEETKRLQARLAQAQKVESVGRLAGGLAHDFNNMLQVILGYADLALGLSAPDSRVQESLLEIRSYARRAADLTRQLLAMARKQVITPRVLDLNATIASLLPMLRRLVGGEIQVVWRPAANLWPVRLDPGQVEQVLTHLCVNARDVIAGSGVITLETGNATLDEKSIMNPVETPPGDYVLLSVGDTGCGIDRQTLGQVFEPFLVAKGIGGGTGMGLPTVYGIVNQNRGMINAESEPGRGTTFRIYLPRCIAEMPVRSASPSSTAVSAQT
jgi:PAS domain S-box-containing protein